MATEKFTKEDFENALPKDKKTGEDLCQPTGLVNGEYTYLLHVRGDSHISIRSSVRSNGVAADTGHDSIRAWLVDGDGYPAGSKVQSYVTRVPGWADRLTSVLRELYRRSTAAGDCPTCGKPMGVWKVKKEGKNKGRIFYKCWTDGHFRWEGEPASDYVKPSTPKIELPLDATIAEMVEAQKTKKDKHEVVKNAIERDRGTAVWALLRIFSFQTMSEQECEVTTVKNNVGFSAFDAELLSSFAKQWEKKKRLSEKQFILLQKKIARYARQISVTMSMTCTRVQPGEN